jgi:hypothetical protein
MKTQSHRQHAWPKTQVVVNPVGRIGVMVLTRDMGANPDPDIRRHIEVSCGWVWLVLIDRRSPVDRDSAKDKAQKERHIQPVTPAHKNIVSFNHEHALLN